MPKLSVMKSGVYLLGSATLGWYKIGLSNDVQKRFKGLRASLPFEVELIGVWPCQWRKMRVVENYLHGEFADRRIGNSEWFALTQDDVIRCKELIARMEAPWLEGLGINASWLKGSSIQACVDSGNL
jgi:hypothetical protein